MTTYTPDLEKYKSNSLTVDRLDMLADFVFGEKPTSTWGSIVAAIKLAFAIAYIFTRQKMVDNELAIAKQKYEIDQHQKTDDVLNGDDLDTRRK